MKSTMLKNTHTHHPQMSVEPRPLEFLPSSKAWTLTSPFWLQNFPRHRCERASGAQKEPPAWRDTAPGPPGDGHRQPAGPGAGWLELSASLAVGRMKAVQNGRKTISASRGDRGLQRCLSGSGHSVRQKRTCSELNDECKTTVQPCDPTLLYQKEWCV